MFPLQSLHYSSSSSFCVAKTKILNQSYIFTLFFYARIDPTKPLCKMFNRSWIAVSAAGPATRPARRRPTAHARYRRRQTTATDDSVQNNTGPLGGPVITACNRCIKWLLSQNWQCTTALITIFWFIKKNFGCMSERFNERVPSFFTPPDDCVRFFLCFHLLLNCTVRATRRYTTPCQTVSLRWSSCCWTRGSVTSVDRTRPDVRWSCWLLLYSSRRTQIATSSGDCFSSVTSINRPRWYVAVSPAS